MQNFIIIVLPNVANAWDQQESFNTRVNPNCFISRFSDTHMPASYFAFSVDVKWYCTVSNMSKVISFGILELPFIIQVRRI